MTTRRLVLLATALLAGGCAGKQPSTPPPVREDPAIDVGMLLFGDHGYDLRYLEAEDYEPPRSFDQFVAAEREDWLEDKRPPAEFRPPASTRLANGGWVAASGMIAVARAMASYCRSPARCDFAAMLGDNIYPDGATRGADGNDDSTRFERLFREPFGGYVDLAAHFRIYAALGNHDWNTSREAALDEVDYLSRTPPFYMDEIAYRVRPPAGRGQVEIFVIDTTVMLAAETVYGDALADDGSELPSTEVEVPDHWTRPATAEERGMAAWLERSLEESRARWKIVIGHHPLWSSAGSKYEQARVLRRLILPMLCRHADAYVSGHDHTLELHYDDCREVGLGGKVAPLPQVVSGAAAKQRALNTAFMQHQVRRYPQLRTDWARGLVWGFAHLALVGDEATLTFVETPDNGSGGVQVVHTAKFSRRSEQASAAAGPGS